MKLRFEILGFEIASLTLDQKHREADVVEKVVEQTIGRALDNGMARLTNFWVNRALKR